MTLLIVFTIEFDQLGNELSTTYEPMYSRELRHLPPRYLDHQGNDLPSSKVYKFIEFQLSKPDGTYEDYHWTEIEDPRETVVFEPPATNDI